MATTSTDQPAHHNFPELILGAVTALSKISNGATKAAIIKHLETQSSNLPADHESVVADHLEKLKASGQLVLGEDGAYALPPPAKRGRGRPPKPKAANAAATVVSPPRPRGRPPKERDPNAPVKSPASGRGRGRPPKRDRPAGLDGSPRPRGRPPKAKSPFPVVGFD